MIRIILMGLCIHKYALAQASDALPAADDVVAKMVEQDAQRRTQNNGYTATRRYRVVSSNSRAEMVVRMTCTSDGEKQFTVLSEAGSIPIRRDVFYRMLREETEASHPRTTNETRIIPANYTFSLLGRDAIENRPAYRLRITPRENKRYLVDGNIWVDATDYSIVRIEGSPAKNPSYWTSNVHFVRTYRKVGALWLAASTHSVSHIRIFGEAELCIESFDYRLNPPNEHVAKADYPASIKR